MLLDGVRNVSGSLIDQNSIFGWFLSGPINSEVVSTFSIGAQELPSDIDTQLRKFWKQEEILEQRPVSKEEEYFENLYQRTTFRNAAGRYVVKLPFRPEFPREIFLGSSRSVAKAQYLHMEHTLKRKPDLLNAYRTVLEEYLTLNHMQPTSSTETISDNGYNSFYLPHHAVIKPESRSTKVRVVFNAFKQSFELE